MFGFLRRKKKKENPLFKQIAEKIVYSMSDIDDEPNFRRQTNIPLLPRGQFNHSIDHELLKHLPKKWQYKWNRLDLDKIFNEIEEDVVEPEKPVMPILKLTDETKTKLTAITLGEMKKEFDEL